MIKNSISFDAYEPLHEKDNRFSDIGAQSIIADRTGSYPSCRAHFFRYKSKFLALKLEFWLRYKIPTEKPPNAFLSIFDFFRLLATISIFTISLHQNVIET